MISDCRNLKSGSIGAIALCTLLVGCGLESNVSVESGASSNPPTFDELDREEQERQAQAEEQYDPDALTKEQTAAVGETLEPTPFVARPAGEWAPIGIISEFDIVGTVTDALATSSPEAVVTGTFVDIASSPTVAGSSRDPEDPLGLVQWQELTLEVDTVLVGDPELEGATLAVAHFDWDTAFLPLEQSRTGSQAVVGLRHFDIVSADELDGPQLQLLWTATWLQRTDLPDGPEWLPFRDDTGNLPWHASNEADAARARVPSAMRFRTLNALETEIREAGRSLDAPVVPAEAFSPAG